MKECEPVTLYSPFFLLLFLPASAFAVNRLPVRMRGGAICVLNLIFYAAAVGKYFFLLPLLSAAVWGLSGRANRFGILLLLGLFAGLRLYGVQAVGLSFFILRAVAYLASDVREKSLARVLAFLLFFPSVTAGPLTRYFDFSAGFAKSPDARTCAAGIVRISAGLVKKLFFADTLRVLFLRFYAGTTTVSAAAALAAYALYLYFDFSGYSDLAVGTGRLYGFDLPENFDFPYLSRSVGEFFHRWHAPLGRFFFDFVYLPLGGSRNGSARTVLSLSAVWLCTSLWHGFSVCYLLWGGWFFCLSLIEKLLFKKRFRFGRCLTLVFVLVGWVFFFSETPGDAAVFFGRLFAVGNVLLYCRADLYDLLRTIPFFALSVLLATPLLRDALSALYKRWKTPVYALSIAGMAFSLACLAAGGHAPVLYAGF